jgi:hypothetical protein
MPQLYEMTIKASGVVTHADGTTEEVDATTTVVVDEAQARALIEGESE